LPLLKRARIEIYLPERGRSDYERLRGAFEQEFLTTFGGCTVIKGIKGLYLDSNGKEDRDRNSLVYADTPFDFDENFEALAEYTDQLREAALEASEEESILIVVHEIYHSLR
jgi:hypothetical protein